MVSSLDVFQETNETSAMLQPATTGDAGDVGNGVQIGLDMIGRSLVFYLSHY